MQNGGEMQRPRRPPTPFECFSAIVVVFLSAWVVAQPAVEPAPHGFRHALPGYEFEFPRDHGTHDEFRTEWWYFTGHLRGTSGTRYGFEATFFRVGVNTPDVAQQTSWDLRNLHLAHFAITDVRRKDFRYYEKLNRSSPFTAGAAAGRLDVFNEAWRVTTLADGSWRLVVNAGSDSIDLVLGSRKPPAIHGQDGVSVKAHGVGYASHYYSMTRLEVTGTITAKERKPEPCTGTAWMDHEFGSSALREHQRGWDWFSVQLDNDTELMVYIIRRGDGRPDTTSSGSLISATGSVLHIPHDRIRITPSSKWRSRRSGAIYPMGWTIEIAGLDLRLKLNPVMENQELMTARSTGITYWEGAVDVVGSFHDTAVRGEGYVEMTGYDQAFRAP